MNQNEQLAQEKVIETKELAASTTTAEEMECLVNHQERSKRTPMKFTKAGSGEANIETEGISGDLCRAKMTEAFGTADSYLQKWMLAQVACTCDGFCVEGGCKVETKIVISNMVMAILNGIRPRDEIEGMLAIQMIGVHEMAMKTMKLAMLKGQTFEGEKGYINFATKMLRTFTAQMDALKKYRTGGQQKMTVEHVHVNEGGQAIVGTVNQGGGGNNDKKSE